MRIERLDVRNFRCFEDRTFVLDDRFTLLIGANATRKTTVLDALAIALGAALLGMPDAAAVSIRREDARRLWRRSGVTGHYVEHYPACVAAHGSVDGRTLNWSRQLASARGRTTRVETRQLRAVMDDLVRRGGNGEDVVLPFIGYYGTGRLWRERRPVDPAKPGARYAGYRDCLEPIASARRMIAGVKRLALIQAQDGARLETLDSVCRAVAACVENASSVHFDFREDDLVVAFDGGARFPFRLLSDGQRNMAAMAADIALRCAQLNPHMNGRARLETPGVVLIDEIDLHLHPRWQRGVVRDLIETFPRLQFMATSHSPFIIQSIDQGSVVNLDNRNDNMQEAFEERSIEDVTEDIMGVEMPQRSRRFRDMLTAAEKYYDLIENAAGSADESELDRLRTQLDELEEPFSDNPAYVAFLRLQRASRFRRESDESPD